MKEVKLRTPIELASRTTWEQVKRSLKFWYPTLKNPDVYQRVFTRILKGKKRRHPTEKLVLSFGKFWDGYNYKSKEPRYPKLHIKKPGEELTYSCSFVPWNRIFNLPFTEESFEYNSTEDLLAHIIWEVTFYGFEKEMLQRGKKLFKKINQIKQNK